MSASVWRCECGTENVIPDSWVGSRVRCNHCGAVSEVVKPSSIQVPPPLTKASADRSPTKYSSVKSPLTSDDLAGASWEQKKIELSQPIIWAAIILGTGTLLLLISMLAFRGRDPQQQAENSQATSGTVFDLLEELTREAMLAEEKVRTGTDEARDPPENEQSSVQSDKVLELADLAELIGPSVVQVKMNSSTGSGFVLDKEGTIVTNFHVIEDETVGTIVFSDRTTAPITGYLGVWPEKDIALLKVKCQPEKLHPLRLATLPPRQGERVAAFGSPLGLQQTITDGICSAIRKSEELQTLIPIEIDAILIQTNAPISPGNSGGPLVNMQGMVVGINTLGFNHLGGENLNFAVAIVEIPPLLLKRSDITLSLPARSSSDTEAHRIFKKAMNLWKAGQDDAAIAGFTEVIRINPEISTAHFARGSLHSKNGSFDRAIADFTESLRLTPDAMTYRLRGDVHRSTGDFANAISDYSDAIRLDPTDPRTFSARGRAYFFADDYERALADFTDAIRLDPNNASAYHARAICLLKPEGREDILSAIADLSAAIRLDPKHADAYFMRAMVYHHRNADYVNAIADFTNVIRLEPSNGVVYVRRGQSYSAIEDYDSATADFTDAIRLDPKNAEAYFMRGVTYHFTGQRARAVRDFAEAKRLGYKDPPPR